MNENDYAAAVLNALNEPPQAFAEPEFGDTRRDNAATAMMSIVLQRLRRVDADLEHIKYTRYKWQDGVVSIRNSRVAGHHWTNINSNILNELAVASESSPVVHLLTHFSTEENKLHVWAIPEQASRRALNALPETRTGVRVVEIRIDEQKFYKSDNSPDLVPYYGCVDMTDKEANALAEGIKLDAIAKQLRSTQEDQPTDSETTSAIAFTSSTIDFLRELPNRIADAEWHAANKSRYETVLRDPTRELVELLRTKYVEALSPDVAATKRPISILKKNDFGQGGYHDHYWFAFGDPDAGSRTQSCQLFFRLSGADQIWRYGFGMGNYCESYVVRMQTAIASDPASVKQYVEGAPGDVQFRVSEGDDIRILSPAEYAKSLTEAVQWRIQ